MMTGLKKSLIYWGRSIEKFFLILLLLGVAMAIFMNLLNGVEPLEYMLKFIPMTFAVALLALAYTNITTSLTNIISMGATRKDSFVGMQFFYHLLMIQGMLVTDIVIWVLPEICATDKKSLCICLTALYILCCAMGNGISIAMLRCSMGTAKFIYSSALVVVCLFVAAIMTVSQYIVIPHLAVISFIAAITGVLLDVFCVVVCKKAVSEYEVRV